MAVKQNPSSKKKDGAITLSDKNKSGKIVETMLEEHKAKIGDVVLIVINDRTTIEVPANLSEVERNIRVANYKKRHKSSQQKKI